jgi:hypothetical protein
MAKTAEQASGPTTETCPNEKCGFRELEDNTKKAPYTREYIDVSDHLCGYCEARLVADK